MCGFAILEAIGQFDNSACAIGAQDRLLQGLQGDPSGDAARQRALESILQVLLLLLAEKGSCDDCAQHLLSYLSVVMVLATRHHVPPLQAFMIGCTTRLRCATLMFYSLMSTFDGGLHSSVCIYCMRLTVAKQLEGVRFLRRNTKRLCRRPARERSRRWASRRCSRTSCRPPTRTPSSAACTARAFCKPTSRCTCNSTQLSNCAM